MNLIFLDSFLLLINESIKTKKIPIGKTIPNILVDVAIAENKDKNKIFFNEFLSKLSK